ncbi:MAG: SPOR domain-containing protein [Bryobacterales bacterium]
MDRSATHDTEYVDIVLGYRHILLFSLVFGVLIFSTGYFAGYQRGQSVEAASAATRTPQQASPPAPLPAVKVPAMLTEPPPAESGDMVKEMEDLTQESLTPGAVAEPSETAAPSTSQPDAEAAAPAAEPREEEKPAAPVKEPEKPKKLAPQAKTSPPHQSGAVYLQVSSFSAPQEAEKLIDDLAAEGFRALIDGQLIGGKHTVLVGPFPDFKTAADRAKDLRQQRREAFPIRR